MVSRPTEMFGDDALVDFVDAKLTKHQYKDTGCSLKKKILSFNHSMKNLLLLKNRYYPSDITKINEINYE